MPSPAADIFRTAAGLFRDDPRREGNVLTLEPQREVLLCGDIHGHRRNLTRVLKAANVSGDPARRLVLQELIHGPADARSGTDRSGELLLRAARLKTQHRDGVLMLLANHDIAQVTGNEIIKDGVGYCANFRRGVDYAFGDDAGEVLEAMAEFFLALPLAVRTPGGVWMSHSLPSPHRMDKAGCDILEHSGYAEEDLVRGGPAYEWTWGRDQTDAQLDDLAGTLGVEYFLLGHRPTPAGFEPIAERAATFGTYHDHGKIALFPGDRPWDPDAAGQCVRAVVAL